MTTDTAQPDSTFARWTFAHYFQFLKEKEKNIIVKCNLCATPRELSTSKNSTSNLKKHLDRCHANTKLKERDAPAEKRKKKEDEHTGQTKQQKLSFSRSAMVLEAREVRRLVAEFIVEDMHSLSTVESPAFRKLVSKIPVSSNDKVS